MLDKITKKREFLHRKLNLESIDSEEILKISQELDKLLVEYYKNSEADYEKSGGT